MHNISREKAQTENSMFLKIRYAALEKAFEEIRNKRFTLDEGLSKGWITKEDYQKDLMKLIIESNEIRTKKEEIGTKLGF